MRPHALTKTKSPAIAYAEGSLLDAGEAILWTGKPVAHLRLLSVLHWVILSGACFAVLDMENAPIRFVVFETLALVGLFAFVLFNGRDIHYLVTDRRVVLFRASGDYRNHSYHSHDLRHAKIYQGVIPGAGGINFTGYDPFPGEWQGLWGIRNAPHVQALIEQIRTIPDAGEEGEKD